MRLFSSTKRRPHAVFAIPRAALLEEVGVFYTVDDFQSHGNGTLPRVIVLTVSKTGSQPDKSRDYD